MTAILIDTNVLVYAHDPNTPAKQERAIETLDTLQASGQGRLSAQCLVEFFCAVTHGTVPRLTVAAAQQQVERLARAWLVLEVTPQIVLEATRGVCDHQLSYGDAQIWATARLNQVPVVFSEDFRAGVSLEGIRFVKPFVAGFRVDEWIG